MSCPLCIITSSSYMNNTKERGKRRREVKQHSKTTRRQRQIRFAEEDLFYEYSYLTVE